MNNVINVAYQYFILYRLPSSVKYFEEKIVMPKEAQSSNVEFDFFLCWKALNQKYEMNNMPIRKPRLDACIRILIAIYSSKYWIEVLPLRTPITKSRVQEVFDRELL
jgi:hypothetical protein